MYDLEHATSADSDDFTLRGTIEVTISKRSKSVRVDSSNIRSSLTMEESKKLEETPQTLSEPVIESNSQNKPKGPSLTSQLNAINTSPQKPRTSSLPELFEVECEDLELLE